MIGCRNFLPILFCLLMLSLAVVSSAEEEIEDLVDIALSKGKIIAIIEGKKAATYNLRPKEKVLWDGSKGYLGAILTDMRFLAISTTSNTWQFLTLGLDESEKSSVSISPYIALLVTGDRAVGFSATANRFVETQLPFQDEVISSEAERYIAIVITSSRAIGLSTESSAFTETHLRVHETVESVKMTFSKATIRTSDRLLTFEATGSTWNEHRLY